MWAFIVTMPVSVAKLSAAAKSTAAHAWKETTHGLLKKKRWWSAAFA